MPGTISQLASGGRKFPAHLFRETAGQRTPGIHARVERSPSRRITMRCLNCNTVVADTDPVCLSCGAQCTMTVREQEAAGVPVPFLGLTLMFAGIVGYVLTTSPVKDRDAI